MAMLKYYPSEVAQLADHVLYVAANESLFRNGAMSSRLSQLNVMDPCPQMTAFCVSIVKNASIDVLRHSQQSVHLDRWDCVSDENSNDLTDECIHNADVRKLTELMDWLDPDDRRFLYLRYTQEMGYKEIGTLLNISEDAAKKRGQRLIKKLRKLYEGG